MRSVLTSAYQLVVLIFIVITLNSCADSEEIRPTKDTLNSVFFQPWKTPLQSSQYNWDHIFKQLKQANINQIIIQWSQYKQFNFIKNKHQKNLLKPLIEAASRYRINIIFGLYHDPNWFKIISNKKTNLDQYFTQLIKHHVRVAKQINQNYGEKAFFSGFYIPQEIALYNFKTKNKQKALIKYLSDLAERLKQNNITSALYASSFYNQRTNINQFVQLNARIINNTPVFIYIQNGTGANNISQSMCINFYSHLARELPDSRWGIIAELFVQRQKNTFMPASPEKIDNNIKRYYEMFPDVSIALYSIKYLIDNDYQILKEIADE